MINLLLLLITTLSINPAYTPGECAADSTRFRSAREALLAAEQLQKHHAYTDSTPLTLRIAPGVYWLDDPDDPAIRNPKSGTNTPFGLELNLSHLRLVGLSDNPEDVILACNRGQTQGANGNFTMLHLIGDDIQAENITFGNYCNVDLVYPRDPSQNRKRREDAIVQAQLIICDGDRIVARNCRFISRLNLCPFAGAKRALFENCYFECTDDALCGTGVYHRCRFTLFSGKPFYNTHAQGARFLDCDLHALTSGRQYLVKVGSQVAMVDCRWTSDDPDLYIGWTQDPTDDLRSYQYNQTLNGSPLFIDADRPWLTVDMTGKPLLTAYKNGDTYNIYNLLKGDDGWNPTGQDTTSLPSLPTRLTLSHRNAEIETGKDTLLISADSPDVIWSVAESDKPFVNLTPATDGKCLVTGLNTGEQERIVNLLACTPSGLESACVLTVRPPVLPAPEFTAAPRLTRSGDMITVDYTLNLDGRNDLSEITWYRTSSADGTGAIPVAVSRNGKPKRTYTLTDADNGYHIMASVAPRHIRSHLGESRSAVTTLPVSTATPLTCFDTDFSDFPTDPQPQIIPGFWTVDAFKPTDTTEFDWTPDPQNGWYYGTGMDGAAGIQGLLQASRGARLMYLPTQSTTGDMELTLLVDPCKSAGQGFGSATGQYMDICIKFDPVTLTGYALRIIRTPKNDKAVDFLLMRYDNGIATPLTDPVTAITYRRNCKIHLTATTQPTSPSLHLTTLPQSTSSSIPQPAAVSIPQPASVSILQPAASSKIDTSNHPDSPASPNQPKCSKNSKYSEKSERSEKSEKSDPPTLLLSATITNTGTLPTPHRPDLATEVHLQTTVPATPHNGICIQHTGSTGASATLLRHLTITWK